MTERICSNGCERRIKARGLCDPCYKRAWRSGEPMPPKRTPRRCSIKECDRPHKCRGWCSMHYHRWQRHGDASVVNLIRGDDERRFWSRVSDPDGRGCRLWLGSTDSSGYGTLGLAGRTVSAHRYVMALDGREVPDGFEVDHFCRVRLCVETTHLDVVTHEENVSRRLLSPAEHFALRLG